MKRWRTFSSSSSTAACSIIPPPEHVNVCTARQVVARLPTRRATNQDSHRCATLSMTNHRHALHNIRMHAYMSLCSTTQHPTMRAFPASAQPKIAHRVPPYAHMSVPATPALLMFTRTSQAGCFGLIAQSVRCHCCSNTVGACARLTYPTVHPNVLCCSQDSKVCA